MSRGNEWDRCGYEWRELGQRGPVLRCVRVADHNGRHMARHPREAGEFVFLAKEAEAQ